MPKIYKMYKNPVFDKLAIYFVHIFFGNPNESYRYSDITDFHSIFYNDS